MKRMWVLPVIPCRHRFAKSRSFADPRPLSSPRQSIRRRDSEDTVQLRQASNTRIRESFSHKDELLWVRGYP